VESEDGQDKKSFTRAAHSLRGAQDFWGSLGEEIIGEEMDCEPGEVDYRILQRLLGMEEGYEIILTRAMKVVEPLIEGKIPRQDVEDVLMEFSLLLIRKVGTYEGRGWFVSWLRKLARCVIAKYYRKKPKELFVDPVEAKEKWDSERDMKEDCLEVEFSFEEVMGKLEELPDEKREIIELYYLREMNTAEIAKALGKPEGTIRRRLSEAMSKLREKF
jgi:RNA polymerase sigma-70 factor (ECF subfamily)